MKRETLLQPICLPGLLSAVFVADVLLTANHLPERLATHFDLDGQADGWMTRASHVRFIIGFGLGVPLFILFVGEVVTRLGGAGLNIPNRDYWLAPERRARTLAFAQRQLTWMACLLVIFFAIINHLILQANTQTPVRLAGGQFWLSMAIFIGSIGVWMATFIRPFLRKI